MAQIGFYFDATRCVSCKTCEMACKDYHNLSTTVTFRNVFEYTAGTWKDNGDGTYTTDAFRYFTSVACNHCDVPACLAACPVDAISKDDDGVVLIDLEVCDGCKACIDACPYHAPSFDAGIGKAAKCDSCISRRAAGKQPICVEACLGRAIEFGDIEGLRAQYGTANSFAPLPDPSMTHPNLVVKPSVRALHSGDTTGWVSNPREIM